MDGLQVSADKSTVADFSVGVWGWDTNTNIKHHLIRLSQVTLNMRFLLLGYLHSLRFEAVARPHSSGWQLQLRQLFAL